MPTFRHSCRQRLSNGLRHSREAGLKQHRPVKMELWPLNQPLCEGVKRRVELVK